MNDNRGLVFVVDDDASVRKSLGRLLRSVGHTVESFASAEEFLDASQPTVPACAILDLAMPGLNGLELQERIAEKQLTFGVVFLTGHGDITASVNAMKHGAVDFLTKPVDEACLLTAVDAALASQIEVFAKRVEVSTLEHRFAALTKREREVMELVVTGQLNKQVAAELDISEKTVKAHRAQVMRKTGARTLAELVHLHIEWRRLAD